MVANVVGGAKAVAPGPVRPCGSVDRGGAAPARRAAPIGRYSRLSLTAAPIRETELQSMVNRNRATATVVKGSG